MKTYQIKIQGVTDLLINKYSHELNKEKAAIPKEQMPEWEEQNWQRKAYTTESKELFLPDTYILGSLRMGAHASGLQVSKKQGKKTISKGFIDSNFLIEESPLIENVELKPFDCNVKIGKATIMTIRPRITKGWFVEFKILDLNEMFSKTELEKLIIYCGKFIGVGDWRPKFGRYECISVKEVD